MPFVKSVGGGGASTQFLCFIFFALVTTVTFGVSENRWFDFGADAVINTNKYIRLTHDRPSQTGWLWSRLPLTATNWQVEVEFKIEGSNPTLYGDGFAIWFTKQRASPGPVFGFVDKFEGLGIFFDTYANARQTHSFPYVMAMIGDGETPYDHDNDGKSNEVAGCEADVRGKSIATKARITYYKENYLELKLQYKEWDQWEPCFTIPNVTLPTVFYLGFTALTGDVSDNHDIVSVTTNNLISLPTGKHTFKTPVRPPPTWSGIIFWFKLLMVMGVLYGAMTLYRAYQTQANKRF
ncbi:12165_t:CDS:2 [Ambispora leptoticha]|uniref:12165_t:CDS:1 n=1 Tax=Ambispora leptoticha TaxID=144679 RepID=A0A9N8VUG8_9GLOM|nr:12165_t:CDS:2 [Ambispora leptoticha]